MKIKAEVLGYRQLPASFSVKLGSSQIRLSLVEAPADACLRVYK